MKEVERHSVTGYGRQDINYNDPEGEFVYYEDYTALQRQLTATINSLTNAQEALKSAGIEADTVQAGVMELKAQGDALAAENATLKSIIEPISNLSQYGDIVAEMSKALRPHEVDTFVSLFETARNMETPATDAHLNAVRAEGVEMLAADHQRIVDILNGDSLFADGERRHAAIAAAAVHFAAQLRAGNAGKDGV